MQRKQSRGICAVLWLAIVVIVIAASLIPTYRIDKTFDGELVAHGVSYPASAELDITYRRDPFFGESSDGKVQLFADLDDAIVQEFGDVYFYPGWLDGVLWSPRFYDISAHGWNDGNMGFIWLLGFLDSDGKTLLLYNDDTYSFAGRICTEDEAAKVFHYLDSWFAVDRYYTENPFSHKPLIDRETAIATRTETPPSVLLKQAVSDFFTDCWEYLLIGVVALVALILSRWFPQIYLNHWILAALREGRSGAKRYLRHSRICFTAMGLTVPLFACVAHLFSFSTPWYWPTGGMCLFGGMIVVLIALIALLHRRVWIPITTQP